MLDKIGLYTDELTFWQASVPNMSAKSKADPVNLQSNPALAVLSESQRQIAHVVPSPKLKKRLSIQTAQSLEYADLLRVHSADYIRNLDELTKIGHGNAGPNSPINPESFITARLSAGLVTTALEAVMRDEVSSAYSFCRSPGHHALPDRAMNSCFLANIPLAIETVRYKLGTFRVAVVDWGAHHGNGTQTIYENNPDVMTISLHQEDSMRLHSAGADTCGEGDAYRTNVNIPLPIGSGHKTYLRSFERIVLPALDWYQPDVIIVSCGFDAHTAEVSSKMLLHSETFRLMTRSLRCAAKEICNKKLLFVHENEGQKAYVPYCSMAVVEEMVALEPEISDPLLPEFDDHQPDTQHQSVHNRWVDLLSGYFGY